MKFTKISFRLLVLTFLLLAIVLIRSAPGWAQSQEPNIYLPIAANESGQQPPEQTPTPTVDPQWQYGYVAKNQVWQNRPEIPVCWINPSPADANERGWVQQKIRNTWEHHSNVRFVGWGECPAANSEDGVRIQVADTGPHVKTLGQAIRKFNDGMVLNFTFQKWNPDCASPESTRQACIEVIAVHEFGHVLAFAHEQNRPDTPEWCSGQEQGSNGDIIVGQWDVNSVMNYCNLNWNGNGTLSDGDIVTLQTFYGEPPTPTPTKTPTSRPTVTPTPTSTPVIRNWGISGKMDIWDEDWPDSDDWGTHVFADNRVLTAWQNTQTYVVKRCTDEVRGEIHLQMKLEAGGAIRATGKLLYFEGASCSTNDLERTQEISYLLRPGETQQVALTLGDGDGSVTFEFYMSNSR